MNFFKRILSKTTYNSQEIFKTFLMKYFKLIILVLLGVLMFNSCESSKDNSTEHLKGLTLATDEDLADIKIKLNGVSFPVYNVNEKRINGQEFEDALMNKDLTMDFYLNENDELKVGNLRKLSDKEKQDINDRIKEKANKKKI